MDKHIILGVHVTERVKHAAAVQLLFTEYGNHIKTRLGLHEVGKGVCSPNGVVLLETFGDEKAADTLLGKLNALEGVECKKMVFDHP